MCFYFFIMKRNLIETLLTKHSVLLVPNEKWAFSTSSSERVFKSLIIFDLALIFNALKINIWFTFSKWLWIQNNLIKNKVAIKCYYVIKNIFKLLLMKVLDSVAYLFFKELYNLFGKKAIITHLAVLLEGIYVILFLNNLREYH